MRSLYGCNSSYSLVNQNNFWIKFNKHFLRIAWLFSISWCFYSFFFNRIFYFTHCSYVDQELARGKKTKQIATSQISCYLISMPCIYIFGSWRPNGLKFIKTVYIGIACVYVVYICLFIIRSWHLSHVVQMNCYLV